MPNPAPAFSNDVVRIDDSRPGSMSRTSSRFAGFWNSIRVPRVAVSFNGAEAIRLRVLLGKEMFLHLGLPRLGQVASRRVALAPAIREAALQRGQEAVPARLPRLGLDPRLVEEVHLGVRLGLLDPLV